MRKNIIVLTPWVSIRQVYRAVTSQTLDPNFRYRMKTLVIGVAQEFTGTPVLNPVKAILKPQLP